VIPAILIWVLVPFLAPWTYTVAFYATLVAVIAVGWRSRGEAEPEPAAARSGAGTAPPLSSPAPGPAA
jgi:hypothetical protein